MNATLKIEFDDGTERVIDLGHKCIEIDLPPESRQSLCINQTPRGEFRLSFTKPLMDGRTFRKIVISKRD